MREAEGNEAEEPPVQKGPTAQQRKRQDGMVFIQTNVSIFEVSSKNYIEDDLQCDVCLWITSSNKV